ncbi:MAG TPA: hypothetical protein VLA34_06710 [Candidatus Krumholzibacterium sp.]|nr:hypothetical protein [Candidatus Krumholzibacterium sp.]
MKRITVITLAAIVVMSLSDISLGTGRWENEGITISPQVLILEYSGTRITVHTSIPAGDVVRSSLFIDVNGLADLEPCTVYADDLGYLALKFDVEEVRMFVEPPRAEMTLHGRYLDGGDFSAAGSVIVR